MNNEIQNRDLPILTQVLPLMQEIRHLEETSEFLSDARYRVTTHLSFTGGSGGGAARGMDDLVANLDCAQGEERERIRTYLLELKRAENLINAIPYPSMRAFVEMLYVEQMPQRSVMAELNMTEWAFRAAKNAVEQAQSMGCVAWREKWCGEKSEKI